MNLKTSSNKPSTPISKWLIGALTLVSFAGFLDAVYLTTKHYLGSPVVCSILEGCEVVTTSQYATWFGIPVALPGAIYYLLIFLLTVAYLDAKKERFLRLAAYLSPIGFLASLWFLYLQLFVIKALCLYCLISALTSTLVFVIGVILLVRLKKNLPIS